MYQQQARPNRSGLILGILIFLGLGTFSAVVIAAAFYANTVIREVLSVEVKAEAGPEIFPKTWLKDPEINPSADPLGPEEAKRTTELVKRELKKYPNLTLKMVLDAVYCVENLRYNGSSSPSTNSGNTIYLANEGASKGYTDEWLEQSLHEQVAIVLLVNYQNEFDDEAWSALLPKGFKYDLERTNVSPGYHPTDRDPKWLSKGFISEFETCAKEEDFASIVAGLMTSHYEFHRFLQEHPALRKKALYAAKFYKELGIKVPDSERLTK